jgi:hypothetical protein
VMESKFKGDDQLLGCSCSSTGRGSLLLEVNLT